MKTSAIFCVAALLGLFVGCDNSSEPSSSPGTVKISLVDAPASYDAINVDVQSVSVHTATGDSTSGWMTINNTPAMYDLLTLQNGASAILGNASLSPGTYTQIRLMLGSGSTIVVNGVSHPLTIPSGLQSGVKLTHEFTIQENTLYEMTLDFDARRSIRELGSSVYHLQPTIRVVSTIVSGTISGTALPDSARPVIYAISGADTIATAYADTTTGMFKLMALPEGTYTVSVSATQGTFQDQTRTGVAVVRQQDTPLGTITLTP